MWEILEQTRLYEKIVIERYNTWVFKRFRERCVGLVYAGKIAYGKHGNWIRNIFFNFLVSMNDKEVKELLLESKTAVGQSAYF